MMFYYVLQFVHVPLEWDKDNLFVFPRTGSDLRGEQLDYGKTTT